MPFSRIYCWMEKVPLPPNNRLSICCCSFTARSCTWSWTFINAVRAKPSRYLPTVLTPDEVKAIIVYFSGMHCLTVKLLYGGGLRLAEAQQLRAKDVNFGQRQLVIRIKSC
nr:hypothetical protein EKO22_06075 [Synechococcus elongatus PCC 11802]